jgi:hypothetical protein
VLLLSSGDVVKKHYTMVMSRHNALQLWNYIEDNPCVKMEDVEPLHKPTFFTITPMLLGIVFAYMFMIFVCVM